MALEMPIITSGVARLPEAKLNLGALSGIVIPIAYIIESPIIMLLSASTALSRDWNSYQKIRRVMYLLGGFLTLIHILVAFTPLYDLITRDILGVPEELIERTRVAMAIVIPWSFVIAHRRFNQGILIREGKSKLIGYGTLLRILTIFIVVSLGVFFNFHSGVALGALCLSMGVTVEAIFIAQKVKSVLPQLRSTEPVSPELTYRSFSSFYLPLVFTAFLDFAAQPICSAAISRMENPVSSLAVWPVVGGISFILKSFAIALTEVVIANRARPNAAATLSKLAWAIALGSTLLTLIFSFSLVGEVWVTKVIGLDPTLLQLSLSALLFSLPAIGLAPSRAYFQGTLVQRKKTKSVSLGMIANLAALCGALTLGVHFARLTGIEVTMIALSLATLAQVIVLVLAVIRTEDRIAN